jgi:hypothetical protein
VLFREIISERSYIREIHGTGFDLSVLNSAAPFCLGVADAHGAAEQFSSSGNFNS